MAFVRSVVLSSLVSLSCWHGSFELRAQQSSKAANAGTTKCVIDRTPLSPADDALYSEDGRLAEKLYSQMAKENPASIEAQAGIVRALLLQNQLASALVAAKRLTDSQPKSAVAQTALGEVYLRRGEFDLARPVIALAISLDPCYGPAYLAQSRFDRLIGQSATAARLIGVAYSLRPLNRNIAYEWALSLQPAQRYSALTDFIEQSHFEASKKEDLRSNALLSKASSDSTCTVVSPKGGTSIPIFPGPHHGKDPGVITIDAQFNGKQQRLQLGTSGSGITIQRELAESLGLKPLAHVSHSLSYRGGREDLYTINVPSIRFAGVEFKNCLVIVRDFPRAFHDIEGAEGYIGTGFFADFLVDINLPKQTLVLSSLPKLPGDQSKSQRTWSSPAEKDMEEVSSIHGSHWPPFDRVVPTEMENWNQIYQVGAGPLILTRIGPGHPKLFAIDLISPHPRISSNAVGEATTLKIAMGPNASANAKDIAKAMGSSPYFMQFSGLVFPVDSWVSANFSEASNAIGVDIAGIISQDELQQLDIVIDYRDSLIQFTRPPVRK